MLLKKHVGQVVMTPKVVDGEQACEACGGFDLGAIDTDRVQRVPRGAG